MKAKTEKFLLPLICFLFLCSGKYTGIGDVLNLIFGLVTFFLIIALINAISISRKKIAANELLEKRQENQ